MQIKAWIKYNFLWENHRSVSINMIKTVETVFSNNLTKKCISGRLTCPWTYCTTDIWAMKLYTGHHYPSNRYSEMFNIHLDQLKAKCVFIEHSVSRSNLHKFLGYFMQDFFGSFKAHNQVQTVIERPAASSVKLY